MGGKRRRGEIMLCQQSFELLDCGALSVVDTVQDVLLQVSATGGGRKLQLCGVAFGDGVEGGLADVK